MELKKILLVDDEESLRQLVGNALSHKGFEVMTAVDGQDGVKKALEYKPNIILVDVMMPNMNGYNMVHALREAGNTSYIIFLTAKAASTDLLKGFTLEGDDFIAKPFQMPELLARIKAGFRLKQTQFDLERTNIELHKALKERDTLINMIATNLRDPINEIDSYLKMLTDKSLPPATIRDLCNARTEKIKRLIDNICEMGDIENHQVNTHLSRTDISEVAQEMVLHFVNIYRSKQIDINYNIFSKIFIKTDKTLISEVFRAILYGAFQVSKTDSPAQINLISTDTSVRFEVSIKAGVTSDILPDLFDSILDFSSTNFKWNEVVDISTFFGLRVSHKLISMLGGALILEMNVHDEDIKMGFIIRYSHENDVISSQATRSFTTPN